MGIWLLLLALLGPLASGWGLPATGSAAQPVEVYELVQPAPAPPVIKARSAILIDLDKGGVLYQLDAHGRRAPASLLKVATALVALEHLGLDQLSRFRHRSISCPGIRRAWAYVQASG